MDCIQAVNQLFTSCQSREHLIAEIQYSYAIFLVGQSIEGLMHWRKILQLLSNSSLAVDKYIEFYEIYLDVLKFQLLELPEELMAPSHKNLIYRDVRQLVLNCLEYSRLGDVLNRFIDYLKSNMQWFLNDNFREDDPDDLPVLVDFNEMQINSE